MMSMIISLLSGVALFLFGMHLMSEGLGQLSGERLGPILFRLSGTPLKGVLFGTGVTAIIQSSCATAVMTVGFVNSGLMKLRQAVSVILGAILGTSVTGWIICLGYVEDTQGLAGLLSTQSLTGLVAIAGMAIRMISKKHALHCLGDILMGFAVLMTGMSAMSASVSHLRDQNWFLASLTCLSHPIAGMIVGFVITAVLQSASAAVGIIQALSVTGVMTMGTALPLLMGVTVGASVPVLLSALGASVQGRRASMVYLVASGIGTGAVAAAFYIATSIWPLEALGHIMDPFSIALVNTLLRLALVLVLLPMGDVLEGLLTLMIPEREEAFKPIHLEERFLNHPSLAIEQCRLTIFDMAALARQALDAAVSLLWNFSEDGYSQVLAMEEKGDRYEDQLGTYLLKLTAQTLSEQQSREVTKYLHVLSDFERITDHARNLAESAREASDKKVIFSDAALRELHTVTDAVSDVIVLAVRAFTQEDMDEAMHVEPLEEVIDRLCDEMKLHHVQRLQQGQCTILQGFIFNDLLTNLERVSDHCSNVAVAMIELDAKKLQNKEEAYAYLREKLNLPE